MADSADQSIVRVYSSKNMVIGTAFMVRDGRILTCAHVVQEALEMEGEQGVQIPEETIRVDFPLTKTREECGARVIAWDLQRDIAVLKLTGPAPADANPARLVELENRREVRFRCFGFPLHFDAGVWATGVIRGKNADGWLQLEDVKAQGYQIEPGFSGGPVWDEDRDGAVGMILAADTDRDRKVAYGIPAEELRALLVKSGEQLTQAENPYRGLEPFEAVHAQYFFGRTQMIQALAGKVSQRSFVTVVGPSGSGKSSLIRAGLLPYLKNESGFTDVVLTPTKNPIDHLILSLLDWQGISSPGDKLIEAKKISDLLQQDPATIQRFFMQVKGGKNLLLVIDQFEELFTLVTSETTRRIFIDSLIAISTENFAKVIIAIRADFYGSLLLDPGLGSLLDDSQLNVLPLSREELREVIEQPALVLGRRFDPGLVEIILKETLGQPGYLPLLEFAMTELWERQTENGTLTLQAYDGIGRVAGAMAKAAEQVVSKYEQLNKTRLMRQVFVRLVQPGLNAPDTRRRATKDEFSPQDSEEIWSVVRDLADARLVVTSFDSTTRDETVEVSHEALIQGWPRLSEWVEGDREFLTWRQTQLDHDLRRWESNHRSADTLLRGESLVIAKRWLRERKGDIGEEESEYIFHSVLNDGTDLHLWIPLFSPFDKVFSELEEYLTSGVQEKQLMALNAMEWLEAQQPEQELRINDRLLGLILTDPAKSVQERATLVLCRRRQVEQLAALLQTKPGKEEKKRIIDALAYARNLPKTGREIDRLHIKESRVIRRASVLQLLLSHINEFAISLMMAFLFAQIVAIIASPFISLFENVFDEFADRFKLFPDELSRLGWLYVGSVDMVWFLGLFLYFYIRKTQVNGTAMDLRTRLTTAAIAFVTINLLGYLYTIVDLSIPMWPFYFFSDPDFGIRFTSTTLAFISGLVYLMVIAARIRVDLRQDRIFPFVFRTSAIGYLCALAINTVVPAFLILIYLPYYLSVLGFLFVILMGLVRSLTGFLVVTMSLFGFYLGLKIVYPDKFTAPEVKEAPNSGTQRRRLAVSVFVMAAVITLCWQVTVINPILPSLWCSMTTSGEESSGLIVKPWISMRRTPERDSLGFFTLINGNCVQALGKSETDSSLILVKHNGEQGWVEKSDVFWFDDLEIPNIDPNHN